VGLLSGTEGSRPPFPPAPVPPEGGSDGKARISDPLMLL